MARSLGTAVENNFTGGLVTEATSLNFPENAVTDTDNCVFDKTGSVYRRPGINYEDSNQFIPINRSDSVVTSYLWRNTGGNGDVTLTVLQNGSSLHFFRNSNGPTSANKLYFVQDLYAYYAGGSFRPEFNECQFSVGNGFLIVTNPACNPFYISYNFENGEFGSFLISVGIRDFAGIEDPGVSVTDRPLDLSLTRFYNLVNQGWSKSRMDEFRVRVGGWPSYADVWWLLKDANGNFKPGPIETQVAVKDKLETVYGDLRANSVFRGNTPAPKGHHILSPFNLDRSSASSIPNIPLGRVTQNRPSTSSFYAGRAFYAGISGPSYTDKIYFSQVIETPAEFGKCYQTNDPTSESLFNLLATDGGVISIPDAGQIIKMFPVATSLLVFASNGLWAISGSTGIGFSATDYSVSKVSSIPFTSASSLVDIEGYPAFWNDEGIYMVSASQAGTLQVQSMSEKKIKTFYNNIPLDSKKYAKGFYNPTDKTIQWLYKSTPSSSVGNRYTYDKALIYSVLIESFYPWTFNNPPGLELAGIFTSFGSEIRRTQIPITTVGNSIVTTTTGTSVTSEDIAAFPVTFAYKYLLFNPSGFTFGSLKSDVLMDYSTYNYSSYFTTGYKLRGEAVKKAQTNYLVVFFKKDYGNSFDVQSLWDYSNDRNSNRWSSKQRINAGRGQYDYDFRRLKIRGQGRAVQYRFESVANLPFNISGWGSVDSVNGNI